MGYISRVDSLRFKPIALCDGVTSSDIKSAFQSLVSKKTSRVDVDDFYYFFDVEVENKLVVISATGNDGKAYYLAELVNLFVKTVNGFKANSEDPGLFLEFELWGEEPGDAIRYVTRDNELMGVRGEVVFDNDKLVPALEVG